MPEAPHGVFVGLATLDVIHRVRELPGPNEKITATAQFVAAGGPAANAAVTFAALGGAATLVTALGRGRVAETIAAELESTGVTVVDVAPDLTEIAPISSVSVIEASGDRSVVGGDAASVAVPAPAGDGLRSILADADVVLLDGHHHELSRAAAAIVAASGLPSVVDAGRWKPIMPDVIAAVSDVVASADFRVPGAQTSHETARSLIASGTPVVVTTAGGEPVRWSSGGISGETPVPAVDVADTLGAGDVFHGAYAFALATGAAIADRVAFAAEVAATRCARIGPRSWLAAIAEIPKPGR